MQGKKNEIVYCPICEYVVWYGPDAPGPCRCNPRAGIRQALGQRAEEDES